MAHYVASMHPDACPHQSRLDLAELMCLDSGWLRSRYRWLLEAHVDRLRARAIVLGIVTS